MTGLTVLAVGDFIVEGTAWATFIAALVGALFAIKKTPLGRVFSWIWRRNFVEPVESWLERVATGPVKDQLTAVKEQIVLVQTKIDATDHYVRYHLGPNSTEPPLYTRIQKLEGDATDMQSRQKSMSDTQQTMSENLNSAYVRVTELENMAATPNDHMIHIQRVDSDDIAAGIVDDICLTDLDSDL